MNKIDLLKKYTAIQALDYKLWCIPENESEEYILGELRHLVYLIEEGTDDEILDAIVKRQAL